MVEGHLPSTPHGDRPLGILFLDFNAYFASVEAAERPELRGLPVAVAPVEAETTFCIAASYEAKAFGIKTGTRVAEARRLCPELVVVRARPKVYVHYHHQVLEAVAEVLPVDKVRSIDEMQFRLIGIERTVEEATCLAHRIKAAIASRVSPALTSSIGIAPNGFLAKVASEMEKPNGLTVLTAADLPGRLEGLSLMDFPGINRRMDARLRAAGIFSAKDMLAASAKELRRAFGSVVGERWWGLLRGYPVEVENRENQSLGHSSVLAPHLRTPAGARDILLRLAQKAAARLRANGLTAARMGVHVKGDPSWGAEVALPATHDSVTIVERILELWSRATFERPMMVSVTFTGLAAPGDVTPSLFDDVAPRVALSNAIDRVNQKFGKNAVFLASLERVKDSADEKIAFDKTWLFSEGKGDHEWTPGSDDV